MPECTGDISSSFFPSESQLLHLSSTDIQVEEENVDYKNELESFNESIEPSMLKNVYEFDMQTTYNMEDETLEEESKINLNTTNNEF